MQLFLDFVAGFADTLPPRILALTGGEPLMRPDAVHDIAASADAHGVATYCISGLFFARGRQIPEPIARALSRLSHLAASIDRYHETFVPRGFVFDALARVRDEGTDVSIQTVAASSGADAYVDDLVADVRRRFADDVPVLVTPLQAEGRAASFVVRVANAARGPDLDPCRFSAWPIVTDLGSIVACCNQGVVDGTAPDHLVLGALGETSWEVVRNRLLENTALRVVRTYGPRSLAARCGGSTTGYCASCKSALDTRAIKLWAKDVLMEGVVAELLRTDVAISVPRYSALAELGWRKGDNAPL